MKLELRRHLEGTGFVILICGERSTDQIAVPLADGLSNRIEAMLQADGVKSLMLPGLGGAFQHAK